MDFTELEAIEGLRWSWNSWPASKSGAASLIIPLSILCTPLMESPELPVLPYEPLICIRCGAALNPYARVDYQSKIWLCPFCHHKNFFPKSYAGIGEHNLPAELFPTYSTVEYHPGKNTFSMSSSNSSSNLKPNWGHGPSSSSSLSSLAASVNTSTTMMSCVDPRAANVGPGFVFVMDLCVAEDELRALKNELLLVVSRLPENALVGLVTFDSMARVYDLGFGDCTRVVLFHGDRELTSVQLEPSFHEEAGIRGLFNGLEERERP
ncbi:hypothetical protein KSS87_020853 [Heliosperma pusillum]|nr:hypothetical protein KSS87_020853 [Heliosperma pusillum]